LKKKIFIAAAVIFCSSTIAQVATKDSARVLDEVIFTAGKYPQKQSQTGKVITIITNEQLQKSSGKTVAEILNQQAGIVINGANNNAGTNQTVSIRGAAAGNTLILIDGIPANDPSVITNYFDINFIATDNIERIEILKGGQSTLYGSDAVAGVINFITKKATSTKFALQAGVAAGSYNSFKEFINIGKTNKRLNYAVNYSNITSTGFSSAYDSTGKKDFDNDKFNEHSLNGSLGLNLSKNTLLKFFGSYNYYKTSLDASAYKDEKDFTATNNNTQAGFGITQKHNDGALHFNYSFTDVKRNYVDDSAYRGSPFLLYSKSNYIGRTHFAELYDNWKWKNYELMLGIDYRANSTTQNALYLYTGFPLPPTSLKGSMSQTSPFASFIYSNKKGFTAEAGARINMHNVYGSNISYSLNPSYLIDNKAKIFINLYSAFKTPTLYQLFDDQYGNVELQPELGTIAEAGVELLRVNGFTARATGFYRNTKNKIEFIIINPATYQSQYSNISTQQNYGAELEAAYQMNKWNITANYTFTDGKTISAYDGTGFPMGKDTTYNNLYRIPKNVFNINIGYKAAKNVYLSASIQQVSSRTEFIYGNTPQTLKGYYTAGLFGQYQFGKFSFYADFKNITNQIYFDIPGYNSRKFNVMTGVKYSL
jgi:vitamin B12 transporter